MCGARFVAVEKLNIRSQSNDKATSPDSLKELCGDVAFLLFYFKELLQMKEIEVLRFRAGVEERSKIKQLQQATGLNASQVLRALIANSRLELQPMPTATIVLSTNANNDVTTRQGSHVVVAA
jgi:hypothetical protein